MLWARQEVDAVLLGDGRVLVVGDEMCVPGGATPGSERTEVYDAGADRWSEAGSLNKPRNYFASLMTMHGDAFVVGGVNDEDVPFSSTKVFAAGGDSWADGPLLRRARVHPLAVALPDGSIVVSSAERGRWTTERLDPSWTAWRPGASPPGDLEGMIALADGRVLAPGLDFSPEDSDPSWVTLIYQPDEGRWRQVAYPESGALGSLIAVDGGAMSLGGYPLLAADEDPLGGRHLQRFDAATESWRSLAPMSDAREAAQIAVLADGRLVVAGGALHPFESADSRALSSVEVYDPQTNVWQAGPDLREGRYGGHLIQLDDGSLLLFGGQADFNVFGDTPWCATPITNVERWLPDERPAPAS
jgi:hypothetical protein